MPEVAAIPVTAPIHERAALPDEHRDWIVGIDIGGTFTDGFAIDRAGRSVYSKVPSTPFDPTDGALACVEALAAAAGVSTEALLSDTAKVAHAQTATVNALLQRQGARVGLLTTKGFGDTLMIMNVSRGLGLPPSEVADGLQGHKPEPLVPYDLIEEVVERVDYRGAVVTPLDEASVQAAVGRLLALGAEAIAVCLLWSFRNPDHERKIKRIISAAAPTIPVSISSEVAPILGEYERMFTTSVNAYLAPALQRYVHGFENALVARGLQSAPLIMQSTGGLVPASEAPSVAVTTASSGLAGGVLGSFILGGLIGLDNIITADMGGTSFEVSLIVDSELVTALHPLAPRMAPYAWRWRMAVPTLDITAIGSGGGSIAWIDDGALKVGPLSAQAHPGPACYGKGGTEPTITDADLLLGHLNSEFFLGGAMTAHVDKAEQAIRDRVADPLGISLVEAASGIAEVANNQMADLLRHLTVHKGYDPRDFYLVAFGGAGPLHVGAFGPELGVKGMVVPGAGLAAAFSALGVALADYRQVFVQSDHIRSPFEPAQLEARFAELEDRARRTFDGWGVPPEGVVQTRALDMRYVRQHHAVEVPVERTIARDLDVDSITQTFETRYENRYGRGTAVPEAGFEITAFRLTATKPTARPPVNPQRLDGSDPSRAEKGHRDVFLLSEQAFSSVAIFDGEKLRPGNLLEGPCVVEYPGTTILLQPKQKATIDEYLNCFIEIAS